MIEYRELLDDIFEITAIVPRIPLVKKPKMLCSDTAGLYSHIGKQFQRPFRVAHQGVESGKGFLKFDTEIEVEPEPDVKESDPAMSRIIMTAITPEVAESHAVFKEENDRLRLPVSNYFHTFHADLKAAALDK